MRKFLVVIAAAVAVILAAGPAAYAELVANTTGTDLTSFGFGVVPPTLTLQVGQNAVLEQGCSIPPSSGMGGGTNPQGSPCGSTSPFNLTEIGSTIGQDSKNTLVTLAQANILTAADMFNLGLLFNTNESNSELQLTLQKLTLGIFNGNTLVGSFSLPNPVDFLTIAQGQGAAGFTISITNAQVAAFEAANGFNNAWQIGLVAQIGCTLLDTSGCNVPGQYSVSDGAESFTLANLHNPIPEPGALLLLGSGLIGLGVWRFRKP